MSDSEYEEEEALVLVELSGVVQSELTDTDMTKFKLLGIHKDKSVLQLGGFFFEGKLDESWSTACFFKEVAKEDVALTGDPVFSKRPEKVLQYCCKTQKLLPMRRVFVKPKEETAGQ